MSPEYIEGGKKFLRGILERTSPPFDAPVVNLKWLEDDSYESKIHPQAGHRGDSIWVTSTLLCNDGMNVTHSDTTVYVYDEIDRMCTPHFRIHENLLRLVVLGKRGPANGTEFIIDYRKGLDEEYLFQMELIDDIHGIDVEFCELVLAVRDKLIPLHEDAVARRYE